MGKKVVVLEIGASSVKVAEFEDKGPGRAILATKFGSLDYGYRPDDWSLQAAQQTRFTATISQVLKDAKITSSKVVLSIPPMGTFPRFIALPPVSDNKLIQMITYEAEQNVPFPVEEILWDYFLFGPQPESSDSSKFNVPVFERRVCLVAAKIASVQELISCLPKDIKVTNVTTSAIGLANFVTDNAWSSVRSSGECDMAIDVGGRSTTIVLAEREKIFIRTIPVAGNAITQELAKSMNLDFDDAEKFKISQYPSLLSGDQQETDPANVIRKVFSRLHAEIVRTICFYTSQQGGTKPTRVWLCGNGSLIKGFDQYFANKMTVPVKRLVDKFFVSLDPSIKVDKDQLSTLAGVAIGEFGRGACSVQLTSERTKNNNKVDENKAFLFFRLFMFCGCSFVRHLGCKILEFAARNTDRDCV